MEPVVSASRASSPALSLDGLFYLRSETSPPKSPSPTLNGLFDITSDITPCNSPDSVVVVTPPLRTEYRCRLCGMKHPLRACCRFRRMSVEHRLRAVVKHRYCGRCLAQSHTSQACTSAANCGVCDKDHNTMLHVDFRRNTVKNPRRMRSLSSVTTQLAQDFPSITSLDSSITTLLPTCEVYVRLPQRSVRLRALLDPCIEMSRLSRSTQRKLQIPFTNLGETAIGNVVLTSVHDASIRLSVMIQIVSDIRIVTPKRDLPVTLKNEFSSYKLADKTFLQRAGIDLVLGGNIYPKIVRPNLLQLRGLPLAQDTIFGWVLSGPYTA